MIKEKYAKSYVEVLELLKRLPQEEYNKIPQEKIDFFQKNKDVSYHFNINEEIPLEEQPISLEANSIMIILFRDYFANDKQKEILKKLLAQNEEEYQRELAKKYNIDSMFKETDIKEKNVGKDFQNKELPVVVKKKNLFQRIIDKIKKRFFCY